MLGLVVALIPRQCGCGNVAAPGYCCSTNSSSNLLIFCARSSLLRLAKKLEINTIDHTPRSDYRARIGEKLGIEIPD